MRQPENLQGLRFGRLTVIGLNGSRRGSSGRLETLCVCDCGKEHVTTAGNLKSGSVQSCGCLQRENGDRSRTHGLSATSLYHIWQGMNQRCHNPQAKDFPRYGGRGIAVCAEWRNSFEVFAIAVGPRPTVSHSLDRFPDNNGNYEPGNVRWATQDQQMSNTRTNRNITANGVTDTLAGWARRSGIGYTTIQARLDAGWTPERAVNQ